MTTDVLAILLALGLWMYLAFRGIMLIRPCARFFAAFGQGRLRSSGSPTARSKQLRRGVAWAAVCLLLAACADDLAQKSAWSLEGRPGLLLAIKQYYQQFASENRGSCRSVLMDGVTRSELISEEDDRLVVTVGYRYRSASGGERRRGCSGFGERTFEAARDGEVYRVLSMSGDRDEGGLRLQLR